MFRNEEGKYIHPRLEDIPEPEKNQLVTALVQAAELIKKDRRKKDNDKGRSVGSRGKAC